MKTCKAVTIFFMILACAAVAFANAEDDAKRKDLDAAKKDKIRQVVEQVRKKYNIPGAVFGYWSKKNGDYILASGVADTITKRPIKETDTVRIGDCTNTYTATLALEYVGEGTLTLDETIKKYTPNVPNADKITVRMLMNHTSGLYDFSQFYSDPNIETDVSREWTPQEEVAISAYHAPSFAPGTGWEYSKTNYIILGLVVEQVTGYTYPQEVGRRLIEGKRLWGTSYPKDHSLGAHYSHGYADLVKNNFNVDVSAINVLFSWSSGAILSNMWDMKEWNETVTEGRLLKPWVHKEQMTLVGKDGKVSPDGTYGLGLERIGSFYGHQGAITGFNTIMMSDPVAKETFVIIVNKYPVNRKDASPVREILDEAMTIIYGDK